MYQSNPRHNYQQQNRIPTNSAQQCPVVGMQKNYKQIKSFGTKAALEFAVDATKSDWHTMRLECAKKLPNSDKKYDWENRISVQITKHELPLVIGVLLGYLPSVKYANHGDSNKGFSIENQGSNFFFKVNEVATKKLYVCPVPIVEAHLMGMLALSQYAKNFDRMGCDAALSAIKTMCSHMLRNNAFPKVENAPRSAA